MQQNISNLVWRSKYCLRDDDVAVEKNIDDTWDRVARAIAGAESQSEEWAPRFREILDRYTFLPGGRVLAGAGSDRRVTLFNCFVAGRLSDSLQGILAALTETALTMQQGGGVGVDFSPLRPHGAVALRSGSHASGPLSFMHIWDRLCGTLLSTSTRRGAMMGTLACDHPDIEAFIDAKRESGSLSNFNLSVLVSDQFMQAARDDEPWELRFPSALTESSAGPGDTGNPSRRVSAKALFRRIARAAHATAEPGVLFIDTINRNNNLAYCETISATNPCGEIPLPPYGACDLGSINLTALVRNPFSRHSEFDHEVLGRIVPVAVRFLDDVIDASRFPLPEQAEQAKRARRIGLGITGLADTLVMLGLSYDSDKGRDFAANTMRRIRDAAYRASTELAQEKGSFPAFDAEAYLEAPFVKRLPDDLRDRIAASGIRNSHLLSIAPAGTISLLAGNVSSGVEPIFALETDRNIRGVGGRPAELLLRDYAYDLWRQSADEVTDVAGVFDTAQHMPARAHLAMQASLQPFVDNAISKTINLASDSTIDDVADIYMMAWAAGVKGCTVYRPGSVVGHVLKSHNDIHCCSVDREAD